MVYRSKRYLASVFMLGVALAGGCAPISSRPEQPETASATSLLEHVRSREGALGGSETVPGSPSSANPLGSSPVANPEGGDITFAPAVVLSMRTDEPPRFTVGTSIIEISRYLVPR
jgi:hypothetical protein